MVTKLQNCKSYSRPIIPIWILAFAVKLAGANNMVAHIYKKIFKLFPQVKLKLKFFNHEIYVQQKVSDKKMVTKVAK